jgi:outer membrane receptor protein involved in Fe transport
LAVRRDDYSDFGATTNPRYGISWKPIDAVHVRASYSTAFRTANAYEEESSQFAPYIAEVIYPSPAGDVPVFDSLGGGGPRLQPEKSRNVTAGIDFEPSFVPNFKASLTYFNIRYRDRIITPSFSAEALFQPNVYGSLIQPIASDAAAQALIDTTIAQGGIFYDSTCGPDGVTGCNGAAGVRSLLLGYELNAGLVKTSGFDMTLNYHWSIDNNNFHAAVNATRIEKILTSFTSTTVATDLSNTFGNPLHWRARGQLGWSHGPWSVNSAVNYSGAYVDTTTAPFASIASWTTFDAQLAYVVPFAKDLSLSVSATNIFNRDPPYVSGQTNNISGIHYDPGNGNPYGRVVVLNARLAW